MIGPGLAGSSFTGYATGFYSGQVGTLTVSIEDSDGNVVLAPTTDGIAEIDAGGEFSVYRYAGTYPDDVGQYVLIWQDGDGVQASEELVVSAQAVADSSATPTTGPCQSWVDGEAVAVCCAALQGTDTSLLDAAAEAASEVLFILSGRQFTGLCTRTVRPCASSRRCSHVWSRYDDYRGTGCGCGRLSEVLLPGAPVLNVIEVLIDGEVVPPSTYRVDGYQRLVRVRDPEEPNRRLFWPSCQQLDLPATEEGTFEVTYLSGIMPPQLGEDAAGELACEIYRGCSGSDDCKLPQGTTQVTRQGVTINLAAVTQWAYKDGRWATGMPLVDLFLATYNPTGARRPPAIFSPDGPQYAQAVGGPTGT